jgi:hypothetical protein
MMIYVLSAYSYGRFENKEEEMKENSKNTEITTESLIKELESIGADCITVNNAGIEFRIGSNSYSLSTISLPSVGIERILPFPEKHQFEFEQAALRANDRDSAVKVRVSRDDAIAVLSVSMLRPTREYISQSFGEYIRALDNTEAIIFGLYSRSI